MKRLILFLLIIPVFFFACNNHTKTPVKEEIPILSWYSIPAEDATLERYQELKDAGFTINFSHIYNIEDAKKSLDFAQQVGIKVMFMCNELRTNTDSVVNLVKNHPALAGYFLCDEPVCSGFPDLREWADKIKAADSTHLLYLNLLPVEVPEEALGDTYQGYVKRFIEEVKLPLVSFDCYPVVGDELKPLWYKNLEIVSEESRKANLPFWAFALATAHSSYPIPTMAELKLQMYSNLAYGAQVLQYFTYWNPDTLTWNFHQAPITINKKRGPVYDRVKELNKEIQNRAFVFANSKVISVNHTGDSIPEGTKKLENLPSFVNSFNTNGDDAIFSIIEKNGKTYLAVVNCSFKKDIIMNVTFNGKVDRIMKDGSIEDVSNYEPYYRIDAGDIEIFTPSQENQL
ncbi:MAG: hypothetical protein Q4F97_06675 [Bacteroidales bacterium]|nr:hypothetical protein [Bacteroidales bacterium]